MSASGWEDATALHVVTVPLQSVRSGERRTAGLRTSRPRGSLTPNLNRGSRAALSEADVDPRSLDPLRVRADRVADRPTFVGESRLVGGLKKSGGSVVTNNEFDVALPAPPSHSSSRPGGRSDRWTNPCQGGRIATTLRSATKTPGLHNFLRTLLRLPRQPRLAKEVRSCIMREHAQRRVAAPPDHLGSLFRAAASLEVEPSNFASSVRRRTLTGHAPGRTTQLSSTVSQRIKLVNHISISLRRLGRRRRTHGLRPEPAATRLRSGTRVAPCHRRRPRLTNPEKSASSDAMNMPSTDKRPIKFSANRKRLA